MSPSDYMKASNLSKTKGFTLSEVIITLTVSMFIIAGVLSYTLQMMKSTIYTENKNQINTDVRNITNELNDTARGSNYFILYSNFDTTNRNAIGDRLYSDYSGDFVLFVFNDKSSFSSSSEYVSKIVGYYRDAEGENIGPILRFEKSYTTPIDVGGASTVILEDLIPSKSNANATEVLEFSKGLARGRLFYNHLSKSLMINARIYHGDNESTSVSDTFNFTVAPRG